MRSPTGRFYAAHRRAWTPRLWPLAVLCVVIVVTVGQLVALTLLEAIALGAGTGLLIGAARWELWRWRHPQISPGEYITDLQRNAHLN
jgi:hypothetical protein